MARTGDLLPVQPGRWFSGWLAITGDDGPERRVVAAFTGSSSTRAPLHDDAKQRGEQARSPTQVRCGRSHGSAGVAL